MAFIYVISTNFVDIDFKNFSTQIKFLFTFLSHALRKILRRKGVGLGCNRVMNTTLLKKTSAKILVFFDLMFKLSHEYCHHIMV